MFVEFVAWKRDRQLRSAYHGENQGADTHPQGRALHNEACEGSVASGAVVDKLLLWIEPHRIPESLP